MTRIHRILAVMVFLAVVAAFSPAVHAGDKTFASAYGSTNNQYMTARRVLSPSGSEVLAIESQLVDAGGSLVGSTILIATSATAGNPTVAYDSTLDQFLVAWSEYNSDAGVFVVKGRMLTPAGSFVGDVIDIASSINSQGDVRAVYSPSSQQYLVTFETGTPITDVSGQFIDGNGTLHGGNFTALPGSTYVQGSNLSYDSVNHRFLIAAVTFTDQLGIQGVILDNTGGVFKSPFTIAGLVSYLYTPAIAYDPVNSRFLVVWELYGGAGHNLLGQIIDADGTLNGTPYEIVSDWTVQFGNNVVYQNDSGRFLVAWFHGDSRKIYGREINSDGTNHGSEFIIRNSTTQGASLGLTYNAASKNSLVMYNYNYIPYYMIFSPPVATRALTINKTGGGTVASDPIGISCGDGCSTASHGFSSGQSVTLTASTENGHVFDYWSGACEGTLPSCTVVMTGDLTVSATFVPSATKRMVLTVARSKVNAGDGTIQSSDLTLNCGPTATTCKNSYYKDTPITLLATAREGSTFTGWKPATLLCPSTGDCTVLMDRAKSVQAVFVGPQKLTVSKHKLDRGDGTVTSSPVGIICGTGCPRISWSYLLGETVVLTAKADDNSYFTGWSPTSLCGTGTGGCTVTMDKAKTVTATFKGPQGLTVRKTSVKKGTGRVTSTPAGIDCGDTCKGSFTYNNTVILSAAPDPGFVFIGWSPATTCPDQNDCTITMDRAKTMTAIFGVE